MRKITVLTLGLLLTLATAGYSQKFGFCNSVALLAELAEVKAADSDLQAFQTQLTKKGQDMVKALQDKAADLQRRVENGSISPKEQQEQEAKLKAEQENLGKYEQEVYAKLAQKREELYKPILDRVNKAMDEVAKENNFALVFDASSQFLLYADETLDVTKLVKTKLGVN